MPEPCIELTLLLAALARVAELEARVAELERPRRPEDYGLAVGREGTLAWGVCRALLPPGTAVHRDELIERVLRRDREAWTRPELAHSTRVAVSVLRSRLHASGWRIPPASLTGAYVLLRPEQAPPDDFLMRGGLATTAHFRTITPECARRVVAALETGETSKAIQHRLGISQETITQIRAGRHWTQREGAAPRIAS